MDVFCGLCQLPCTDKLINDNDRVYCCQGCRAVYSILSSKGILENFKAHPIFEQALKNGLISNPILHEAQKDLDYPEREHEKFYLDIGGMWCPSCAEVIQWILGKEKGVTSCSIDYSTDLAIIRYLPRFISKDTILKIIQQLGYQPKYIHDLVNQPIDRQLKIKFIIAAFCSLNLMMFATPLYASILNTDIQKLGNLFAWISFFTVLPVIFYSALPIIKRSWTSLSIGKLSMESLAVLGISSAFILSTLTLFNGGNQVYFETLSVIITFILLGKIIESKAKFSSKNALFKILRSLPKKGRKQLKDGSEQYVPIKEIALNDIIIILTGEKIPLDSVVINGEGVCDESLLTGEAQPISKNVGDLVYSGSILLQGKLACLVKSQSDDSTLNKIVSLVEQEIIHKKKSYRLTDVISQKFVPIILAIATLTFAITIFLEISDPGLTVAQTAFFRSLAVLLISCPCAIGIATPIAESRLIHVLADAGALVRNRDSLQYLGRESVWIFDKTGTLTEGNFTLINGVEQIPHQLYPILKGLCSSSNHPLSKTLLKQIPGSIINPLSINEFPGKGLLGIFPSGQYVLGSANFAMENGIQNVQEQPNESKLLTFIYFGKVNERAFPIALGDKIRAEAPTVVQALKNVNQWILSGDSKLATSFAAKLCGIEQWKASCSPSDKKNFINDLKRNGQIVAMVGDGINDAPALATAHIGLSLVNASDISIQASDILITNGNLQSIPNIREKAIKGRKIIRQNLFWAFAYNVIGLAFAAFGFLSPLISAFAMISSSLFVIFNSKRI